MSQAKENFAVGEEFTAAQANQATKNANDAGGFDDAVLMGEAFTGATTPQAAYVSKIDNKLYICDGNDLAKLKFVGFVSNTGSASAAAALQCSGIVRGFTGLAEGEKYYLQDDKTIGTTPGRYEILVGIAISPTQLLIVKGKRHASGITSFSASGTKTVTLGFRPSKIIIHAIGYNSASDFHPFSHGGWTKFSENDCVYYYPSTGGGSDVNSNATYSWLCYQLQGAEKSNKGIVENVTDTAFDLTNTKTSTPGPVYLFWEAEGEF